MIVQAGPQIQAIFLHDVGRQFVAFLISVSRLMLCESFRRRLAGHAHIQALKHAMELWVGLTEFGAFGESLP